MLNDIVNDTELLNDVWFVRHEDKFIIYEVDIFYKKKIFTWNKNRILTLNKLDMPIVLYNEIKKYLSTTVSMKILNKTFLYERT